MNSKHWAVVLGCDVNGLGIIRSLGGKDISILALDHNPYAIGFHSKFVSESIVCPNPLHSEFKLTESLMDIGKRVDGIKILFPAKDSYVTAIAKSRNKLEPYYKIPFSGWDVTEHMVDKERQYRKAAEHGIPMPDTFYPREEKDIGSLSEDIKFPLILKPAYSEAFFIRYGIKAVKCNSGKELMEKFKKYTADGFRMIVQKFIEGDASQLYEFQSYINNKGEATATFVGRKLEQYLPDLGTGTHFVSVKNPRIVDVGLQVLKIFAYHGISFVEFKLDQEDGEYKLIEINPRTTHSNSLSSECGVNIPYAAYEDVTGGYKGEAMLSYMTGREWIWPENGFLERKSFMIYIRNIFTRKNYVYAIFSFRDLLPEIVFLYNVLRQYIEGFFRKIKKVG